MPKQTLSERIARFLMRDKIQKLDIATQLFMDSYERQIIPPSPEKLAEQMAGLDPQLVDYLVSMASDRGISASEITEPMRQSLIRENRSLYLWDVVTQSIIDMWTDFAFGSQVTIRCFDPQADEWFSEFWQADRNSGIIGEPVIKDLSTTLLVDGELYLVFFISTLDGQATVRTIPADQITEIIYKPGDSKTPLYYKRDYIAENGAPSTIYYKDWLNLSDPDILPTGSVVAGVNDGTLETVVKVMRLAYRMASGRGIPLMTAGAAWTRAYKNFVQDRAAVARHAAMYPSTVKVKGGQRAVDDIRSRIESNLGLGGADTNPPAPAGSTWIENESVTRTGGVIPTGAVDANIDGAMMLAQAGLAGRIYPHYLGKGEAFRLATATAMERPTFKAFNRYQRFWIDSFHDIVRLVLAAAQDYGGKTFSSLYATVSLDPVLDDDPAVISTAIQTISSVSQAGLLSTEIAQASIKGLTTILLKTIGVEGVNEIMAASERDKVYAEMVKASLIEEMEMNEEGYKKGIDRLVYGLWSMKLSIEDFATGMITVIDKGLRAAWEQGLAMLNLRKEDMTDAERDALNQAIIDEYSHVDGFALWIMEHNKASGTKLSSLQYRTEMWHNRYRDMVNRAMQMASINPPLTWMLGNTSEHCSDCLYANGRTYRAEVWERWGWRPQSPKLECKGFNCRCGLYPAMQRPMRGHPRRLEEK